MIPVKAKDVLAMDRQYHSMWAMTSSRIIPGPAADVRYDWLMQHKIHIVCENRDDQQTVLQTPQRSDLQFEDSGAFAQHHLDKVPVVDGIAVATRHLNDHLFQLQVGFGDPQFLHHALEPHEIYE